MRYEVLGGSGTEGQHTVFEFGSEGAMASPLKRRKLSHVQNANLHEDLEKCWSPLSTNAPRPPLPSSGTSASPSR